MFFLHCPFPFLRNSSRHHCMKALCPYHPRFKWVHVEITHKDRPGMTCSNLLSPYCVGKHGSFQALTFLVPMKLAREMIHNQRNVRP